MVLLSIPFNELPWLLPLANNLIIGIENQILADLEKYIVHTWMEKQIGLLLSDHRYCIHRYIKYTLRYRGYSSFSYIYLTSLVCTKLLRRSSIDTYMAKKHPQNYFIHKLWGLHMSLHINGCIFHGIKILSTYMYLILIYLSYCVEISTPD